MNYYIGVKGGHKIYASPTPPNNTEYIWLNNTGLSIPTGVVKITTDPNDKTKLLLVKG